MATMPYAAEVTVYVYVAKINNIDGHQAFYGCLDSSGRPVIGKSGITYKEKISLDSSGFCMSFQATCMKVTTSAISMINGCIS